MMKQLSAAIAAATLLAFLAGCASIASGSTQEIRISSQPAGAKVSVLDARGFEVATGQTPVSLTLDRGESFFKAGRYTVAVEKPGYQRREFQIKGELNAGWYLVGNFFVGGLIGWIIVDPITGAMWNLSPKTLSTALEVAGITADGSIHVALADEVAPELLALATPLGQAD